MILLKNILNESTGNDKNGSKLRGSQWLFDFIKQEEGDPKKKGEPVLTAYKHKNDPWTIGYGHTAGVKEGDLICQREAEEILDQDIKEFEGYVKDSVTVDLDQNQFDALVSWVFNLGPANLKASTMLKVLNSSDFDNVPAQIKRWNKAGGKVLEGLIRRREAEALLFEGKEWHEV